MQLALLNPTDVAVYVQQRYDTNRMKRCEDVYAGRGWSGISMLKDALHRSGIELDLCTKDTVTRHKTILVSIISATDWYGFIKERMQWPIGNYTVIVGGSGVDNIRPFLEFFDIVVWGRAESIIVPLIKATLEKQKLYHPSVCYSKDFSPKNTYKICQAETCYPNAYRLMNGTKTQELAIGCQRKCLFCNYSWTRKHVGLSQTKTGSAEDQYTGSQEVTLFELDLDDWRNWPDVARLIIGVDGLSERLRFMVNKPITRGMLEKFYRCLVKRGGGRLTKVYNIVGLPTETEEDWEETRQVIYGTSEPRYHYTVNIPKIEFHSTPFKPPPCTPVACWPVLYERHRETLTGKLRHESAKDYEYGLYGGQGLDFKISYGTESLYAIWEWMIAFRGTEQDAWLVRELAKGLKGPVAEKLEWLENRVDVDRFFGWYTWDTLPTKYLTTYVSYDIMAAIADKKLRQYGGQEGAKLADQTKGIK